MVKVEEPLPESSPAGAAQSEASAWTPDQLPTADLIAHLLERRNHLAGEELEVVRALAQKVASVHGRPHLVALAEGMEDLATRLEHHLDTELRVLYPALASGGPSPAALAAAEDEHRVLGWILAHLREVGEDYQPPPEACRSWRALYAGLEALEADLLGHVRLEAEVLFKRFAA